MKSYLKNRRLLYALLVIILIPLGLICRKFGHRLPYFLNQNLGDVIWATMIYFGIAFIWPVKFIWQKNLITLAFSFAIEFSQLYHASWIDSIRHTILGQLVLGDVFAWGDMVSYAVGVGIGAGVGYWFSDVPLFKKVEHL